MSRFIDADSYLKNFCNRFCSVKQCTETQKKDCCIAISLEEEPTAFDVDKVVEQLKQQKRQYERRAKEQAGMNLAVMISEKFFGKACSYGHAIEIVKEEGGS